MAIDLICQNHHMRQCLIAPSTELLNRFLLQYMNVFERHNCIVPLVDEKLYAFISEKEWQDFVENMTGICFFVKNL